MRAVPLIVLMDGAQAGNSSARGARLHWAASGVRKLGSWVLVRAKHGQIDVCSCRRACLCRAGALWGLERLRVSQGGCGAFMRPRLLSSPPTLPAAAVPCRAADGAAARHGRQPGAGDSVLHVRAGGGHGGQAGQPPAGRGQEAHPGLLPGGGRVARCLCHTLQTLFCACAGFVPCRKISHLPSWPAETRDCSAFGGQLHRSCWGTRSGWPMACGGHNAGG